MLNPNQDVIDLINEFGTRATLRISTKEEDAQTGDPIRTFTTKTILVIPFSLDMKERIQNPVSLTKQPINVTTKYSDNAKINDEIIIGTNTYTLMEITESPIFSYIPNEINNSIAIVTFRAELKQTSA